MREFARQQTAVLLRRLAFQVNRASKMTDADAIHDLRVAVRRLSRALRVFGDFFPRRARKQVRRELADLLAAAGAIRDRDIALELLNKADVSKKSAIVSRLETERRKASEDLVSEVQRWNGRGFSAKWRRALEL
jgi:CHAD domain-containing protein